MSKSTVTAKETKNGRYALILVDHGSKLSEANAMIEQIASLVSQRKPGFFVTFAHMELAKPDLLEAFRLCVETGLASHIIVFPFFLGPGKHSTVDIPLMAEQCASHFANISYQVTEPIGIHEKLVDIVLERSNITQVVDSKST
eukprot:jgi/Galph1/3740/GphlegSOOS_G2443.1